MDLTPGAECTPWRDRLRPGPDRFPTSRADRHDATWETDGHDVTRGEEALIPSAAIPAAHRGGRAPLLAAAAVRVAAVLTTAVLTTAVLTTVVLDAVTPPGQPPPSAMTKEPQPVP